MSKTMSPKKEMEKAVKEKLTKIDPKVNNQWYVAGESHFMQRLRRVSMVIDLILDGYDILAIWRKIYYEQGWHVSYMTISRYYKLARQTIIRIVEKKQEVNIAIAVQRFNELYRKARDAGEYMTAVAAQRELSKLLGLYAPVKLDVSGDLRLSRKDREELNDISDFMVVDGPVAADPVAADPVAADPAP